MGIKYKIGIHGVPRSGTTWLGQILNSSPNVIYKFQPLFSYELKDYLNENSNAEQINSFFEKLEITNSDFLDQVDGKIRGILPVFKKEEATHIVYKEVRYHHLIEHLLNRHPQIRIIGIIRNPLATINSWLNSPREFRKDLGWTESDEWRFANKKNCDKPEEFFGFEKWKEVAYLFHNLEKKFQDRFFLVNYNNLLRNTETEVSNLFDFCNLELTNQTMDFIKQSREVEKGDRYSVFKNKEHDDDWKSSLSKNIAADIIEDLKSTALSKYL